jgi:hypothetical protein
MPNLALEGVRAVTPLTQGARDLSWLQPRHVDHAAPLSEQLYDQLTAEEQIANLDEDRRNPLWKRTLMHAGIGAGLGGLLAGGKTLVGTHGDWSSVPVGAGIGAASGAVLGAAFTGAKELLAGLLRRNARRTIRESSPTAKLVMRSPRFRSHVSDYALSGWHPWYGAELGLYAGALGTAAHDWVSGTPVSWKRPLIGGGIGAAAGGLLGYILSERRRKKLLHRIRDNFGRQDRARTRAEVEAARQAGGELANADTRLEAAMQPAFPQVQG